jgi:chitinase
MQNLEIENLSATLDWINLMAYDLAGQWDPQTGHNAPLYDQADNPADDRLNWNSSIDAYLAAGVPNDKLVIGAPFYGRVFGGVGSTNNGLFQPDTQIVSGTDGQSGYLSYWDIQERYLNTGSGYTRYWDNEAQVPYLYNPDTQQFVTYDDEQSIGLKADFINDRNLGGLMFWELATDARDHSLLNTVYDRIGGPPGPPSLRVSDASVIEGNSGTSTLTFLVTLTRASEEPIAVDFATHDATAIAGQDYTETSGTLTFAVGETSREVSVGVLGEALEEANETLLLKLSNATGAELALSQAAGTILDDDTPIAVSVAFEITGDWGSGHVGNVTITNNTTETITGWRLEFDYSGEIQSVWSSILVSRDGNHYVVECPSWAEDIAAGSTVSFGWNGNGPGGQLSNVTLNGLQAILS